MQKCFACGRKLGQNPWPVDTGDDQVVLVGSDCYRLVKIAGMDGYRPSKGGPRLYLATFRDGVLIGSLAPNPSYGHRR